MIFVDNALRLSTYSITIFQVLKDDELRKKYDRWGEKGLEDGFNGGQRYESWDFYHQVNIQY